jgi:hypothetical protein
MVGAVVLVLSALPNLSGDPEGKFLPLWIAMVLAFFWASALAYRRRADQVSPATAAAVLAGSPSRRERV